jgi:hypothetical protein
VRLRIGLDTEATGKILLPLPGIEPLLPGRSACSHTPVALLVGLKGNEFVGASVAHTQVRDTEKVEGSKDGKRLWTLKPRLVIVQQLNTVQAAVSLSDNAASMWTISHTHTVYKRQVHLLNQTYKVSLYL